MTLSEPNDGFRWTQVGPGPALVCGALESFAHHLFSTRAWPLGSGRSAGQPAGDTSEGDLAWDDVAAAMGVDRAMLIRVHQVHGIDVLVRRAGESASTLRAAPVTADIVISDDPGVAIAIQTADCVPVLIVDRRTGSVGAAHAGWRGLAAGVPHVAIDALSRHCGSRPEDLIVAAGPSIRACCYEVGEDVRERFERAGCSTAQLARWFVPSAQPADLNPSMKGLPAQPRPGHWYFDSAVAVREMLEAEGVPTAQIFVAGLCTASHPGLLCSFRRDGAPAGRMAAAIRGRQASIRERRASTRNHQSSISNS